MTKAYLEPDEVAMMEQAASNLRDKLLIRTLFHLGCRITEALSLKVDDIDFNRCPVVDNHCHVLEPLKQTIEPGRQEPFRMLCHNGEINTIAGNVVSAVVNPKLFGPDSGFPAVSGAAVTVTV